MRTGSQPLVDTMTQPKEVGLRATFRKSLLVFTMTALTDSLGLADPALIDVDVQDSGIFRVTSVGNVLYIQHILDIHAAWPAWSNTGIALYPGSRPAVDGGYVWYQAGNGTIYYRPISNFANAVSTNGLPGAAALAPIGNRCYALWQRSPGSYEIVARGGTESCHYTLYGLASMPRIDAVSFGGKEYLYTMDRDAGRIIEIQHSGNGISGKDSYGVGKPIIPIDAIDEVYGLKLGYASVVDQKVVVTGRLTRTSDDVPVSMDVYSIGPEFFSFGRDMFIHGGGDMRGKMLRVGDEFVVAGATTVYFAKATNAFGGSCHPDLELLTQDFSSISLSEAEGRTTNLSMDMSPDLSHAAASSGSDIELEMAYNDEWCKLATLNLEADQVTTNEEGKSRVISGVGKSARRLAQWSPDQGIWIPSQARMHSNPASMTQVVRAAGQWESTDPDDEDAPARLKDLNRLGVLYSAARPSRGGAMRGKFYFPSDSHLKPYFGVAINYYRESAAEAAERLGVEVDELEDDMYGHNGIVAIYGTTEHNGGTGISLNLWKDSVLTRLTSVSVGMSANTWYWLQVEFIEGEVRVKYRNAASSTWLEAIVYVYNHASLPWKRETLGRGAIVVKNVMPSKTAYGIGSSDMTLCVDSNSDWPASGTILIDNEQVIYNGKSGNSGYGYPLYIDYPPAARLMVLGSVGGFLSVHNSDLPNTNNYYNGYGAVVRSPAHRTFRIDGYAASFGNPVQLWTDYSNYSAGWTRFIGDPAYGAWANTGGTALLLNEDPTKYLNFGLNPWQYWYTDVQVLIKPAFYITDRGANGTAAVAHGTSGTMTATLYTDKSVQVAAAASFSQDEDQTMEDAIRTIVGLAGGKASCRSLVDEATFSGTGVKGIWRAQPNFVASFDLPPSIVNGGGFGIACRGQASILSGTNTMPYAMPYASGGCYYIEIRNVNGQYWLSFFDCPSHNVYTVIEDVPLRQTNTHGAATPYVPTGTVKVSVQDSFFSVWLNGRYLHTFYDARYSGSSRMYMALVSRQAAASVYFHVSELDDLLADIVVGTRGNGMSVLGELIADRHILWREEPDGSLYFYKGRDYIGSLPDIVSGVSEIATDNVISRVRAEGLTISEVANLPVIHQHGSSFVTLNARHANDVGEARAEANYLIDESYYGSQPRRLTMDVHPGLQPGDTVEWFDHAASIWKAVSVRGQQITIGFMGSSFGCDMRVDGFFAEI
jgi:hypothetical protein